MRVDEERLKLFKERIGAANASVCLSFMALSSAMQLLSISIKKCSEILAENAERLKGYEQGSD